MDLQMILIRRSQALHPTVKLKVNANKLRVSSHPLVVFYIGIENKKHATTFAVVNLFKFH